MKPETLQQLQTARRLIEEFILSAKLCVKGTSELNRRK